MQELRDIYGRHSLEFYEALEKSGISAEQRLEDAMDADVH